MLDLYSHLNMFLNKDFTVTHVGQQLRKNRIAEGKLIREVAAECQLGESAVSRDETSGNISVARLRKYVTLGYLTPEQALAVPADADEDAA